MANTNPICSTKETLDYVRNKSKELDLIDIHQCPSVTKNFDGVTLSHLEELKEYINTERNKYQMMELEYQIQIQCLKL